MMSGYRLMGIEENKKYKGKNVFYFMESEKFVRAFKSILVVEDRLGGTNDEYKY